MDDRDAFWMSRALAEAERGRGGVEPNPMVGAVIVRDGRLVGFGHHQRFGGPHAEVFALREAADDARGATVYVTLEPCCHHGKTPPCAAALINAGVSRVVAAMRDPFPKVAGGGFEALREAGIEVEVGCLNSLAARLNAPYLKRLILGEPYVIAKWPMTLDGRTATSTGHSAWISNARSGRRVHETRGQMDAILVGIGTAIADDPQLTARPPGLRIPARVVLDRFARLPMESRLVQTAREIPVWLAVGSDAPADRLDRLKEAGVDILTFSSSDLIPIPALLKELAKRGVTNLLVEGGSRVLGGFLDAGCIDEVDVYIAPIIEGGTHRFSPFAGRGVGLMGEASRLEQREVSLIDDDIRLRGTFPFRWLTEVADTT